MEIRRTMTMNWDGIGDLDDDEDLFFDAERLEDLPSSSSDEEYDDSRMSFSTAVSSKDFGNFAGGFDMWMAAPDSITDRRRRLLEDMGLSSNKDLSGLGSSEGNEAQSRKIKPLEKDLPPVSVKPGQDHHQHRGRAILMRSTSDGRIDTSFLETLRREEEMMGSSSKRRLIRTSSGFSMNHDDMTPIGETGSNFKKLDNRKEFAVKECNDGGNWNKLRDAETGQHSEEPKVKEVVQKAVNDNKSGSGDRKLTPANSSFKKSFKKSKKKGAALFKNMKLGSMGGSKSGKERDAKMTSSPSMGTDNNPTSISESKTSSQWVKVRVQGKSYKEFTAMHRSQEIRGHEGSIWAMKFTYDGRYLATAGEDKLIHIWEVQECDVMSLRSGDDPSSAGGTPVHPMAMASPDARPPLPDATPEKKKKGKKKKGIPDYVQVPESVFGLSETPFCTLEGHLEGILDLSWSKSQLLLSSSMDKTVMLWDIQTKECLKSFSHTDYVTSVQFNPANDDYFISGSLDSKVRIWNIPDRQVADYIDLHEMISAIGYSPDGKVSVVGSVKGICRFYDTSEYKLELKDQIELKTKKKPQPKKITGFQFSPTNPSEVLVTSADSRVRILDGTKVIQKFKGYKNINSQFSADFSHDGKYVVSASEDSQVYIWRYEENRKNKRMIMKSYELFPCKDVSVTSLWPGSSKHEPPTVTIHSKKHSKRSTTTMTPSSATASPPPPDETGHSKRSSSLPPVPKKSNSTSENVDDTDQHTDSSVGSCDSFTSAAGSPGRFDEISSPSPSFKASPWSNGIHNHKIIQASAWGFVIVTAGAAGEIKVFQNVGLPFKVGRL